MSKLAHIIGAGLAGLSAALRLSLAGYEVRLYEAGAQAGGRCRSYVDEMLGCRIDNGNHLLLSGNSAALDYLGIIGAGDSLAGPKSARFPFIDLADGRRWVVAPNDGPLPYWLADPSRRVADTRMTHYLAGLRLALAGKTDTVEALLGRNRTLYRRFWEPLAVAALNTAASEAAAWLLWPVVKETFGRGAAYCRPLIVREGLSESFVLPALDFLAARGATIRFGARVRRIVFAGEAAAAIDLGAETIAVAPEDAVIVAVPPNVATGLLTGLVVPDAFRSIVNVHYRLPPPYRSDEIRITGVIGGMAEWIFEREDIISVTISAATKIVDLEAETIAARVWTDVVATLGLGERPQPVTRVVKEKRATFAHTPDQIAKRPKTATRWRNVALAGDWTDTGLPATIEGTIRSGAAAARHFTA